VRFASELGEAQSPEHAVAAAVAAAVQEPILRDLVRTTAEEDADQVLADWAACCYCIDGDGFHLLDAFISYMEGARNNNSLNSHSNFRSKGLVASVR
jgi:hypothetical protein